MRKFVSVGVTILDILGRPMNAIAANQGSELIEQIRITAAGTAAGPAVIGAKLGLDTTLIGAIGKDDMGAILNTMLVNHKVDTRYLQRYGEMPTSATILAINSAGERPNFHALGAAFSLTIDAPMHNEIVAADHIHWGGVGLMPGVPDSLGAEILAEARANGATVTADLIAPGDHTWPALEPLLPHIDYFMPAAEEAMAISGATGVESAAAWFLDRGGRGCIFKMGAEGSYLATAGETAYIPSFPVQVVDTTGCGDSYCAALHAGLSHGMTLLEACHFASATAALVASGLGSDAGVKDFDSTLAFMNAHRPQAS
ncbi:carbohydrate kinase family protein [Exilibacterium tricleocarpae]|nr:carbohydrate kinase family protein [Exilibacterium tricleocarpae]